MNICILGAGAWGTAMALHLNRCGHTVSLVPRRLEHAMSIAQSRVNEYLPEVELPLSIQIGFEPKPALMEADLLLFACPSKALKPLVAEVASYQESSWRLKMVLTLCKGLDEETLLFPAQLVSQELGDQYLVGTLSGPTNANEVAQGKPAAMVMAVKGAEDEILRFQRAVNSERLRVYRSDDVLGVELGACIKNVYAIAAGISDGLNLGDNARAALVTRAMAEMVRFGTQMGGQADSLYGLGGLGDLMATCFGDWSRNKQLGLKLAKGKKAKEILETQKTVVEGYRSTASFYRLCEKNGWEAPILGAIFSILYEGLDPVVAIQALMNRDIKKES